jgi:hypothetical protein
MYKGLDRLAFLSIQWSVVTSKCTSSAHLRPSETYEIDQLARAAGLQDNLDASFRCKSRGDWLGEMPQIRLQGLRTTAGGRPV